MLFALGRRQDRQVFQRQLVVPVVPRPERQQRGVVDARVDAAGAVDGDGAGRVDEGLLGRGREDREQEERGEQRLRPAAGAGRGCAQGGGSRSRSGGESSLASPSCAGPGPKLRIVPGKSGSRKP